MTRLRRTLSKFSCVAASALIYKDEAEEMIADLAAETTNWTGDWGLTAPGAIASFKACVMTKNGNENGGRAFKIVRPLI